MENKNRLLIIEDDNELLENYIENLQKLDLQIDKASSKIEAIEKLKCRTYHVAMVDIMLSNNPLDRGGIEAIKYLDALNEGTNIIVLSASDDVRVPVEAWNHGAIRYLIKKYIRSSEDYIKEVRAALKSVVLKPFGKFADLKAYLARPQLVPYWEDPVIRLLGAGYDGTHSILSKTFDPLIPVLRKKDYRSNLSIDNNSQCIYGQMWSKALGCGIWVCIGNNENTFILPGDELKPEIIIEKTSIKTKSIIWRLKAVRRSDFLDSLWDQD